MIHDWKKTKRYAKLKFSLMMIFDARLNRLKKDFIEYIESLK